MQYWSIKEKNIKQNSKFNKSSSLTDSQTYQGLF